MASEKKRQSKWNAWRSLLGGFFQGGTSGGRDPGPPVPPEAWLRRAASQGDREAQEKCRALGLRWEEEE